MPDIVPYISYTDAKAAIAFLCAAFGFETVQAIEDEQGRLVHAELRCGDGVIMLGSVETMRPSDSIGTYVVVDVDAHFERAMAAGAQVVYPPEDTGFGTRRYRAHDPEGHEWSFGSYRPQTEAPAWS